MSSRIYFTLKTICEFAPLQTEMPSFLPRPFGSRRAHQFAYQQRLQQCQAPYTRAIDRGGHFYPVFYRWPCQPTWLPPVIPITPVWTHTPIRQLDFRPCEASHQLWCMHPDLTRDSGSHVEWDVSQHPSQGYKYARGNITSLNLTDNAVYLPAVSRITINFAGENTKDAMQHWGPIEVAQVAGRPITVQDVMSAVYSFLRRRVRWREYYQLSSDGQRAVLDSFYRRCDSLEEQSNAEILRGIRRVDCLRGFTRFGGLNVDNMTLDGRCELSLKLKHTRIMYPGYVFA